MAAKPWVQFYESHVPERIDYPSTTLPAALKETTLARSDHPAMIFKDRVITYCEFNISVDRLAAALQELGVKAGDRVAVHLINCPQFPIAYYAILRIGGVVVPCNPIYTARELKHQLNDSGAEILITLSLMLPTIRQIRAETPLRHIIVAQVKTYFPPFLRLLFSLLREKKDGHRMDISGDENTEWFSALLAHTKEKPRPVEIEGADLAVLMYTGGTTGVSKGAQLTHRNILVNACQTNAWVNADEVEGGTLTALPLFHSYAMTMCMNASVLAGGTMVLIPNPRDTLDILKSVAKHRPAFYPGVPAMYVAFNNHPQAAKFDLSSVRGCCSGAAPLPVEVQQRFQELTGARLVEGYGLSEASPVTHGNPTYYGECRIGTVGIPWPDTEVKLVDGATGEPIIGFSEDTVNLLDRETHEVMTVSKMELANGRVPGVSVDEGRVLADENLWSVRRVTREGELCIRGPQVMTGYWNRPDETANTLRPDPVGGPPWLYTGDIAVMDEDGYFRIVDRKKDMILGAGGLNIYPREIEDVLYEHPQVLEAAAVGIPVAEKGERVKVFIVLKSGETATEEEIVAFCRENLAPYKVPRFVEFRDELPKSAALKVLRRVLLAEELAKREGGV